MSIIYNRTFEEINSLDVNDPELRMGFFKVLTSISGDLPSTTFTYPVYLENYHTFQKLIYFDNVGKLKSYVRSRPNTNSDWGNWDIENFDRSFLQLTDTPNSYAGKKLQFLNVNNDEIGIDFAKSDILFFHKIGSNEIIDISNPIHIPIPSIYNVKKAKIQMVVNHTTNVNYGNFRVYASINNMVNYYFKYYAHVFRTTNDWSGAEIINSYGDAFILPYIELLFVYNNNERIIAFQISNMHIRNNYFICNVDQYRDIIDLTNENIKYSILLNSILGRNCPDTNIINISIFTDSSQTIDYELWVYITPTFT